MLTVLSLSSLLTTGAEPGKYNVLMIVADDLNSELGSYGGRIISPHIDALARSGLLFERAYCQEAVCGPSRASALSGIRPRFIRGGSGSGQMSGEISRRHIPVAVDLPELFRNHGYRTLSVGKVYHHGEVETGGYIGPRMKPDLVNWSELPWYHGTPYQQWYQDRSHEMVERLRALPPGERPRIVRGPPYEAASQPDEVYADGQIASQAVLTLRRLKQQDDPFFLAVGFRRPHLPFNCPQKYWDLYPEAGIALPENHRPPIDAPPIALHDGYELRSYASMPAAGPFAMEDQLALIRGYRAAATYMDAQLGRVLAELKRLDLDRSTIVIFWSDHGYHLGENGLWTKMSNFEIGVRVPLIIRVPGRTPGRRTSALIELVDMYPSLAELCGLPQPDHLEGTSFVPLLDEPDRNWKLAAFSQFPRGLDSRESRPDRPLGRSIVTARHRYTEWATGGGIRLGTELYDLERDPGCTVNLAAHPEQRALVEELSRRLDQGWQAARPLPEARPVWWQQLR